MAGKVFKKILLVSTVLAMLNAKGSHLVGGEITARRIDNASLAYEVTVTGYIEEDTQIAFGNGVLDFGDGNDLAGPFVTSNKLLPGGLTKSTFKVTHIFKGPSAAGYLINYSEQNARTDALNTGSQLDFYVESLLVIDPFIGTNNTPVFLAPPMDWGQVGVPFLTNPSAYDPDGDLLTYRLIEVKSAMNTPVLGYQLPNDPSFYTEYDFGNGEGDGPPTFSISRFNGDLVWNAPGDLTNDSFNACENGATYNLAIAVDEWRLVRGTWKKLGYVARDYIVNVCAGDNVVPIPAIDAVSDSCVIAGTSFSRQITSRSRDASTNLTAFGEPFELSNSAVQNSAEGFLTIDWTPTCAEARSSPYRIHVRSLYSEISKPVLTSYTLWDLYVQGPEVTGLSIQDQQDGTAILSWDPYSCPNADSIEIWRKVGDYEGDICDLTDPQSQGFDLVGDITAGMTTFTADLPSGTTIGDYTWHLKATFPGSSHDYKELISVLTNVKSPEVVGVNVFPNPSNGTVFIDGHKRFKYYRILDISGKLMLEGELKTPQLDNLNVLEDGIYIMSLLDEKQNQVHGTRLLIQK